MSEWQPIETMPSDGKQVIGFGSVRVHESTEDGIKTGKSFREPTRSIIYRDKLFGILEYPYRGGINPEQIWTHWMPLPPDPVS